MQGDPASVHRRGPIRASAGAPTCDRCGANAVCSTSSAESARTNWIRVLTSAGHVLELGLVAPREDHPLDPRAVRGQHLLLDAADGQHLAAQRDLARSSRRRCAPGARAPATRARASDRHARRRAVLGDRARRHVDVHRRCCWNARGSMPERAAAFDAQVRQRRLRRLAHHVAEHARSGSAAPSRPASSSPRRRGSRRPPASRPARSRRRADRSARRPRRRSAAGRGTSGSSPRVTADAARRVALADAPRRLAQRSRRARARGCARPPRACSRAMIAPERLVVDLHLAVAQPVRARAARATGSAARCGASPPRCSRRASAPPCGRAAAAGCVSVVLAVQMKSIRDRSNGTPR